MSIQYPGGVIVNTTFASAVKTDIISNLQTQLGNAGWSVISGGGTTNLLMESVATPQGLKVRARIKDNAGTCVQVSIESGVSGAASLNNTNAGASLIPGFTYRIVACQYQFCIYANNNYANGRMFALVSCPYIIPPANNNLPTAAGILIGDCTTDGNASQMSNPRVGINLQAVGMFANNAAIWGANVMQNNNSTNTNSSGCVGFFAPFALAGLNNNIGNLASNHVRQFRSASNDTITADAILMSGLTLPSDQPQIWAQLWGAIIRYNSYAGDYTDSFDGHNWVTPANNVTGVSTQPIAQLFLITS